MKLDILHRYRIHIRVVNSNATQITNTITNGKPRRRPGQFCDIWNILDLEHFLYNFQRIVELLCMACCALYKSL